MPFCFQKKPLGEKNGKMDFAHFLLNWITYFISKNGQSDQTEL